MPLSNARCVQSIITYKNNVRLLQAWKKCLFPCKLGRISLQQDRFPSSVGWFPLCISLFFFSKSQNFPARSFPFCLFFPRLQVTTSAYFEHHQFQLAASCVNKWRVYKSQNKIHNQFEFESPFIPSQAQNYFKSLWGRWGCVYIVGTSLLAMYHLSILFSFRQNFPLRQMSP